MTTHNVIRDYKFALKTGRAKCSFCNKPLTAQDEVTITGERAKVIVHKTCAAMENE